MDEKSSPTAGNVGQVSIWIESTNLLAKCDFYRIFNCKKINRKKELSN